MSAVLIFDTKLQEERDYWLKRLEGIAAATTMLDLGPHTISMRAPAVEPPLLSAGLDKRRLRGRLDYRFDPTLTAHLHRITGSSPFLLYTLLVGGLKVCLRRYTDAAEVAVGSPPLAACSHANALVIVDEVRDGESFRGLLQRVRQSLLDAYAHQRYPYHRLLKDLGLASGEAGEGEDPERPLLFDVAVELKGFHGRLAEAGESLRLRFEEKSAESENGGSSANANSALSVRVKYDEQRYSHHLVTRLIVHCEEILRMAVADTGRRIGELEMLRPEERRLLLEEWNRTERPYPQDRRIHDLFAEQAARTPERIALVGEEQRVTYRELERRANQLGHYLRRLGVGPEALVGLCLERSVEMVTAIMGVLKAGGAYLPLDPEYPPERRAFMLKDAGVRVALTREGLKERLPASWERAVCLDAEWERISEESEGAPESEVKPENLAYVIYTSGSTGRPKGVMAAHQGLCNLADAQKEAFRIGDQSRVLQFASLSFDASVSEIFSTLAAGGSLHVYGQERLMPGTDLVTVLREDQITTVTLPPSVLAVLGEEELDHLQTVIAAGEACAAEIVDRWARLRRFLDAYGPTEVTVCASIGECEAGGEREPAIGRPIANMRLYILDGAMKPVPVGVRGELYIAGAGVTRGYLGRPELTAERFIPSLFGGEGGERLYRTGDVCRYLPDGTIEFVGRADDQVKVRGYRIELGEIKAALDEHEAVKQSMVVVSENGRGEKQLVGYVVGEEEATAAELKRHLRERLPEYMAPSAIVVLEKMPLTANGKVDRRALPAPDGAGGGREYEAPIGATEIAVAQIWAEILVLERVGRNDNFFELRGHSLLAARLIERMRQEGLRTNVRALFTHPTLAAFAAVVGGESGMVEVPPNRIPPGCEAITPEMLPLIQLSAAEIEHIVSNVPGGAANVQDIYPLAPLQEGILFHYLLNTEGDIYMGRGLYRFDTRNRLESFLQALRAVIHRHDILRTAVQWKDLSEPVQVVWRHAPLIVEEIDFDPAAGEVTEQLRARFDPRHYRLDIAQAPMMRICVAPAGHDGAALNDNWVMLLLFQHLSIDHMTVEILLEEIQSHLLGRAEQLPAPLPFRNFVAQARQGISREEHEGFFRTMLGDVDEPTTPYGLINVQGDGSGITEARRILDAGLALRLRQAARALGVSTASLFHLAWARVLAQTSGRDDVVFGTVLLGRMLGGEGAVRMPGMFINTLPVRIGVGEANAQDGVRQTHRLLAELLRHEHAPLAMAQRCSGVAAPAPLFSTLLNYRHSRAINAIAAATEEPPSAWKGIMSLRNEERSNYPFIMSVDDWGEAFSLIAQVESPIDPDRVCAYLYTALERLAEALESDPTTPMHNLDVLPASERRQLLIEWNAAQIEPSRHTRLQALFEGQVNRTPDNIAVVCEGSYLSYAELNGRANQLAYYLRELGVGPEVRVGICLERSMEMVVGLLGILKADGAYVPMDTTYPDGRLKMMVEDAEIRFILTDERSAERCPAQSVNLIRLDGDWRSISKRSSEDLRAQAEPDNAAYVIFTSGSTGRPKGVAITHASACMLLRWAHQTFSAEELHAVLCSTSICFDLSVFELFAPLTCGGQVILVENALALAGLAGRGEVTLVNTVPSAMTELVRAGVVPDSVKVAALAGEPLLRELVEQVYSSSRTQRVLNLYGPTEATTYSTWTEVRRGGGRVSIGRPITGTGAYVLDARMGLTPLGAVGELYLGGEGLARGYWNRPDLTAERFVPDPFSEEPGARLYRTGDLTRHLPDGEIEYLGRLDQQVKIRGYRIELGEIEAHLGSHPSVQQCVVVAHQDEAAEKRLVAYLVCEVESEPSDGELRSYLKERAPEFMLPSWFVRLKQIPLTPSGKVDRRALPAFEDPRSRGGEGYIGPRMPVEEIVAGIFKELLNPDRVGINDDFFELGGHSLFAIRLISRVRNIFGVEIGMRSVFEESTVAGLARKIEEAMRAGVKRQAPPLVRASREERLPLSFAQRRLWFIDQLDPGNAMYNISGAVRLKGDLNLEALERSVNEIVRRHEALRTRIEVEVREPAQVIDEWEPRRLEVTDLTSLPPEEKEEEAGRISREEVGTGFDLRRGPLLRVKVLKLGEEEHVLLYTMHHIVSDGWSLGILIGEVGALYQAYISGAPSPLEELEIQYADYAKWQRQYLKEELLDEQLRYWRKQLGGELPALKLVMDLPRQEERSRRAGRMYLALPPELAREITALCRREGVTLFMTLLTAFKVLLSRYSGQEDIIVGTVIANRNSIELERLIGFFVNTLPIRTDLSGDPTFRELLARVREVVLGAYAHQDVPFEMVVDEVQPKRSLNQTPLFRAVFVLQNTPGSTGRPSELSSVPVATEGGVAKFDLTFSIVETNHGLIGTLEYDADLFDEAGIKQAPFHFRTLLENIVENPDLPLSSLRLLSDLESEGQGPLDFPDLPLSQRDFENILLEIGGAPNIQTT